MQGGTYAVTQKTQQEAVHCVEARLAEPQKLDQSIARLQELLPLSDFHRQKLLERGLTEKQISGMDFAAHRFPGTEGLARRLMREGYSLKGIPGFFLNGHGNWGRAFFKKNRGFLCPVYGMEQNLSGFQIRLDEPYNDRKYLCSAAATEIRGPAAKAR